MLLLSIVPFTGLFVFFQYQKFVELQKKMDSLDEELAKQCEE